MKLSQLSIEDDLRAQVSGVGITDDVWAVMDPHRNAGVLSVASDGVRLFSVGAPIQHVGWSRITEVDDLPYAIIFNSSDGRTIGPLSFVTRAEKLEAAAAISVRHGGARAASRPSEPPRVAQPDLATTERYERSLSAYSAQRVLTRMIVAGVLLECLGGLVVGVAWPYVTHTCTGTGLFAGCTTHHHGMGAAVLGWGIAGIGALFLQFGLIGWAVVLGVRGSRADS